MATVIPAIKAKIGTTQYYETTMKVRDLVHAVRPPREMDGWANFSIEERMQRDPDVKRIKEQLAPYLVRNADRFFGSLIVLVHEGTVIFEAMSDLAKNIPAAYKQNAERIGFLTIDGGSLIVLDGQHRLLALRMVQQGEIEGANAAQVVDDEVCVIFVQHESELKTRRIFNVVNRYAKQTNRGDNIITSEDDGYAIVARHLLRDDAPLASRVVNGKKEEIVNWKSNTLTKRSLPLTTISAVYESVRLVLDYHKVAKLNPQERPTDEEIETYNEHVSQVWEALLEGVHAYKKALDKLSEIPAMREDASQYSLLFKPASQIAIIDGVLRAVEGGLTLKEAIVRLNKVPSWSMEADEWRGVIIKAGGSIDAGPDARRRMAALLSYLLAADTMDEEQKYETWKMFNEARHRGELKDPLPSPTVGKAYTLEEGLARDAKAILKS